MKGNSNSPKKRVWIKNKLLKILEQQCEGKLNVSNCQNVKAVEVNSLIELWEVGRDLSRWVKDPQAWFHLSTDFLFVCFCVVFCFEIMLIYKTT